MPYKIVRVSNNVYNVNNHDGSVPFKIIKRKDSDKNLQFSVINSENGKIHARHTSLKQAKAQIRLLQAIKGGGDRSRAVVPPFIDHKTEGRPHSGRHGWKPYVIKNKNLDDNKEMPTQHHKTSKWVDFIRSEMKGKKFKSKTDVNNYMKELGKIWKSRK